MVRPRLSYANVMSTLGVFIALGGTSYAVAKLPRNSVGSEQVRDRSLKAKDLASGAIASATRGPRGLQGPAGPPGASAAASSHILKGATVDVPPVGNYASALNVDCPAGEAASGGGVAVSGDVSGFQHTYVTQSHPIERDGKPVGWFVAVRNDAARDGFTSALVTVQPWVVCAR